MTDFLRVVNRLERRLGAASVVLVPIMSVVETILMFALTVAFLATVAYVLLIEPRTWGLRR